MHGEERRDFAGTLHYIAPEQAQITSYPIDERVDIYGLGVTFYESLTGEKPFSAESAEALLELHVRGHIPLPSHKPYGIPQSVDIVIRKCLRKSPQDRYRTAGEAREDLLVLLKGGHLAERFL